MDSVNNRKLEKLINKNGTQYEYNIDFVNNLLLTQSIQNCHFPTGLGGFMFFLLLTFFIRMAHQE